MNPTALSTLLQHAEGERDRAIGALRRAEDQLLRMKLQADQLLAYRSEYQQRWSAQFRRSGTAEIVQCYRSFMERLDEAITQQRAQLDATSTQIERQRALLQAAEMRVASVSKLVERRLAEQRGVQARREQRQSDESAQRQRWHSTQTQPLNH